jgi:hypothetical protein
MVGLLQSPSFLYRVEVGQPSEDSSTLRPLSDHELASRLAYTLTDGPPDATLRAAADRGTLRDELSAQVDRLLESEPGRRGAVHLFAEHFQLFRLADAAKSSDAFPDFSDALVQSMRDQTLETAVGLAFDEGLDFRALLTTRRTYLDDELARHYDVPLVTGESFVEYELPEESPRSGILTHASLMSAFAHGTTTSPTLRGRFILETLLCQAVPAPPADVATTLPESTSGTTQRERLEQHVASPECATCHTVIDPLGLAFENFDAVGRYPEHDQEIPIDATGTVNGVEFDGPAELADLLTKDPRLPGCFVRTVLRNATGALVTSTEQPLVEQLERDFEESGFRVKALLKQVTTHPAFATVAPFEGTDTP